MPLFCRLPSCEYHTKPFDGVPSHCPVCKTAVFGSMIEVDDPDRNPDPAPDPERQARPRAEVAGRGDRPRAQEADRKSPGGWFKGFTGRSPRPDPQREPESKSEESGPARRSPREPGPEAGPRAKGEEPGLNPGPRRDVPPRKDEGRPDFEGTVVDIPKKKRRTSAGLPVFRIDQITKDEIIRLKTVVGAYDKPLTRPIVDGGVKRRQEVMGLLNTAEGLRITPLESLNGVFLRIESPAHLRPGTRFRIGDFVIEAGSTVPWSTIEPKVVRGERFLSKNVKAPGILSFLRPDGLPGLVVPIFRPTVIGRGAEGNPPVDLPLLDLNISEKHALVSPAPRGLLLEDTKSTNGTFLQITGPTLIERHGELRVGDLRLEISRLE